MKETLVGFKQLIANLETLKTGVYQQLNDVDISTYHQFADSVYLLLDITESDINILLQNIHKYEEGYITYFQESIIVVQEFLSSAKYSVLSAIDFAGLHFSLSKVMSFSKYQLLTSLLEDSKHKLELLMVYLESDFTRQYSIRTVSPFSLYHRQNDREICLDYHNLESFTEDYFMAAQNLITRNPFSASCEICNTSTDLTSDEFDDLLFSCRMWHMFGRVIEFTSRINITSTCLHEFERFLKDIQAMLSVNSKPEKMNYASINLTTLDHYQLKLTRLYDAYAKEEYTKSDVYNLFSADISVVLLDRMDLLRSEIKDVLTSPLLTAASDVTNYMTEIYSTGILATWLLSTYIYSVKGRYDIIKPIFDMDIWRQPLANKENRVTYEKIPGTYSIPEDMQYFVQNDMVPSLEDILDKYLVNMKQAVTIQDDKLRQLTYEIERDVKEIDKNLATIVTDMDFNLFSR